LAQRGSDHYASRPDHGGPEDAIHADKNRRPCALGLHDPVDAGP
jgi:hypothetical protein